MLYEAISYLELYKYTRDLDDSYTYIYIYYMYNIDAEQWKLCHLYVPVVKFRWCGGPPHGMGLTIVLMVCSLCYTVVPTIPGASIDLRPIPI